MTLTPDATSNPPPSTQDALELLHDDHVRIHALLAEGARLAIDGAGLHTADRSALIARLGALLQAHEQIEAEIFYPALETVIDDIDAARRGHQRVAERLAALQRSEGDAGSFDQNLAGLADAVATHVQREEEQLFPAARRLDLQELGTRLALRRGVLLGDQGTD